MDNPEIQRLSEEIKRERLHKLYVRTDRLFAILMAVQFLAGIAAAYFISPRTWTGADSAMHPHMYAAIGIGGALAFAPIYLALTRPGETVTRHVIGVAQMLFSALLIHLTGGRIETHFHIFGSLAFLAFYRDWRVLVPATIVVGIDHVIRGIFWPESVFGVIASAPWRAVEHIGWVAFEDIFLIYSCVRSTREIAEVADRVALLKDINTHIEHEIQARTQELQARTFELEHEVHERKMLETQLVQAQKLEAIGQLTAGIAHEINTPTQYVSDNTRFLNDQLGNLLTVVEKYAQQIDPDMPEKDWSQRVQEIQKTLEDVDYEFIREEIPLAIEQSLDGLDRISSIIRAMKAFSHPGTEAPESVNLNNAISSTVTVCRNRWKYVADLEYDLDESLPPVPCFIAEFNQVILNLVVNAADAIEGRFRDTGGKGRITISTRHVDDCVEIRVSDNGGGIPEHVRTKMFDPFYTTKQVGKGTGQGLAISHDVIVQKHGGEIRWEPNGDDGSVFVVRMPLEERATMKEAA